MTSRSERRHASHIVHANSRASWRELENLTEREAEILALYERATHPLTDRQVAQALRRADMNYVRPRITGLLQRGILRERDTVRDPATGRKVRRCALPDYLIPQLQQEMPL